MFVFQRDSSNLEDFITYCWASVKVVREGVYEVSLSCVSCLSVVC